MLKKDDETNPNQSGEKNELNKKPMDLLAELIRLGFIKPNISRSDVSRALEVIGNFLDKK
jgi:hypothetical protein